MNNFDTVRLALTFDGWTPDDDEHRRWVAKALAALAQIEADHFSAADMADAQAKAFRAGVASVQQGEPVSCRHFTDEQICKAMNGSGFHLYGVPPGTPLYTAAPVAQQAERKPLFANLIEQHPGLKEELKAMGDPSHPLFVPQAEAVQYTQTNLDLAYSAGMVEGERLAIQQAEKRCQYCDGTGDVHSIDGQWRGECHCQKQPQDEHKPLFADLIAQHPGLREELKAMDEQPQAEAMPSSDLNPDEGDPVTLWAEIWRLREAVKGPDGYATWQDAATAERIRRVRAESKQAEEAKAVPTHDDTDLIKQMLEALRSCSGVSHWPALIPTINAARKRLETPQQAEAVPSDVVRDAARYRFIRDNCNRRINIEIDNAGLEISDTVDAAIDAAIAQQKGAKS